MSAVFHAEYSFMYVTALDIKMLEAERQQENITNLLSLLARIVRRIDGFFNWSESVINMGNALLEARSVEKSHNGSEPGLP